VSLRSSATHVAEIDDARLRLAHLIARLKLRGKGDLWSMYGGVLREDPRRARVI